eukprot:262131_1
MNKKIWYSPHEIARHITSYYDKGIKYYRNDFTSNTPICANIDELYHFHLNWAKDNSVKGWINRIRRVIINVDKMQIILIGEYELLSNNPKFNHLKAEYLDDMLLDEYTLKIVKAFGTNNKSIIENYVNINKQN